MYPSSDSELMYETAEEVYFFSGPFDPLNNFSAHTVQLWGVTFNTVEHGFQWKKFSNTNQVLADKIKNAVSPWQAKQFSRQDSALLADWSEVRVKYMKELITAKVSQHKDVQDLLQSTGTKMIIENSPVDAFWGCGADGTGENMMGKILMEVRASQ